MEAMYRDEHPLVETQGKCRLTTIFASGVAEIFGRYSIPDHIVGASCSVHTRARIIRIHSCLVGILPILIRGHRIPPHRRLRPMAVCFAKPTSGFGRWISYDGHSWSFSVDHEFHESGLRIFVLIQLSKLMSYTSPHWQVLKSAVRKAMRREVRLRVFSVTCVFSQLQRWNTMKFPEGMANKNTTRNSW